MKKQTKILIANRGEIALRILRTCREMGIPTVAIFTNTDELALHVRYADEAVCIGDRSAYLNSEKIIAAAKKTHATMVHPGYGFLSENAAFCRAVEANGMIFIGPRPETIDLLGDKLASREAAQRAGLPVLPGSDRPLPKEFPVELAIQVDYPILVKAAAGGGGRGIRLARSSDELPEVIQLARQEALAAFGDDSVFLESMVQQARHIEVQIIGDGNGKVVCLGERECSIQRRHQKLIEESPAPNLPAVTKTRLYQAAQQLGSSLRYRGLGTVEFLFDKQNQFHFIEVNPRIQVEHPVTEMVTGLDLVKEQLMLAMGNSLTIEPKDVEFHGAAIEARILAEDPSCDFLPSTGQINYLREPGGIGIRLDSALYQGIEVTADYDSLLAKVIAWGENRSTAIQRLHRALDELQIGGISTDLEFLKQIITSPKFIEGDVDTTYLEEVNLPQPNQNLELEKEIALAAALFAQQQRESRIEPQMQNSSTWQQTAWSEQM